MYCLSPYARPLIGSVCICCLFTLQLVAYGNYGNRPLYHLASVVLFTVFAIAHFFVISPKPVVVVVRTGAQFENPRSAEGTQTNVWHLPDYDAHLHVTDQFCVFLVIFTSLYQLTCFCPGSKKLHWTFVEKLTKQRNWQSWFCGRPLSIGCFHTLLLVQLWFDNSVLCCNGCVCRLKNCELVGEVARCHTFHS